jgi:hypothetical protein
MTDSNVINGSCHCGAVHWTFAGRPEDATICNCTICRRYGAIWAYDWLDERITVRAAADARDAYIWGDKEILFHRCATCGCVTDWTGRAPHKNGKTRIAVNLRLAEPAEVADIPLRLFEGRDTFEDLPQDGRCIRDIVV